MISWRCLDNKGKASTNDEYNTPDTPIIRMTAISGEFYK